MKKYLLVFIFFVSFANAQYIKWYYNYDIGHKEALKQNKNVMLFLKDENQESSKMFKETFVDKNLIEFVNKNYVSIQLPFGTDKFPLELYYTLDSPSLFFATKYEILYGEKFTGYISALELLEILKKYEGIK